MKKIIIALLGAFSLLSCQQKIEYTSKDWVSLTFPEDGATILISAPTDEITFSWENRDGASYKILFDNNKDFSKPYEYSGSHSDSSVVVTAAEFHKILLQIDPEFKGTKRFFWRVDQTLNGKVKSCWRYFDAVYVSGSFTDERDGVTYNTIEYQVDENTKYVIMTDNLRATEYSDGTALLDTARTCNAPDYVDDAFFVASVGCYYSWRDATRMTWTEAAFAYEAGEQVQGICPDGWHLPSYDEWDNLISYFGGETDGALKTCTTKYWKSFTQPVTNELKFNVYPSGQFWSCEYGIFCENVGKTAFFWSSTPAVEGTSFAWGTYMEKDDMRYAAAFCIWAETSGGIYKYYRDSGFGTIDSQMFPVRCIRNYEVK